MGLVMTAYFYRLGHCPDLAVEEYHQLSGDTDYQVCRGWLLGKANLPVNWTGSLVFGGQVLAKLGHLNTDILRRELPLVLEISKQIWTTNHKKIGLVLPMAYYQLGLDLAKKIGFKKVKLTSQLPNFGSWKAVKNWVVLFEFAGQFHLGAVLWFSNQEFWAKLDTSLPHSDIQPGIMNLKLGRSLLNLTQKRRIWDPFCGQGRLLVAGFDRKDTYLATDVSIAAIQATQANWQKAEKIWNWGRKFLQVPDCIKSRLVTAELDARHLHTVAANILGDISQLAIVTEGYLGKNFQKVPTAAEIQRELHQVLDIWSQVLRAASQLTIPEMIFCLPVYLRLAGAENQQVYPKFQERVVTTGYKLLNFQNGRAGILYMRQRSFVGHWIVKAVLAD